VRWNTRPLGDCVKFLSGGTPNKGTIEFWGGDIPWVSSAEMTERFVSDTSLRITPAGLEAGSRLVPEGVTFAVVRGMSLAKEFRISLAMRPMAFNQDVKALIPKEGIDGRFIFYSLSANANAIRDLATEAAHGTKKLEMDRLYGFRIHVPDDPEAQKFVASVAYAYDKLIATNQRRIVLLEEAARRLYREWFVHLRFPGHEAVKLVDGLPEGWQPMALGDVCEAIGGGTPSTTRPEFWDGDVAWVTPTDVTRNDCLALLESERKITEAGLNNSSAKLVPPNTILMTSRASIGFFALMDVPVCTNQGFISVLPKLENSRMFLLQNLLTRVEEMVGLATGATFKELSKKSFRALTIVWPAGSLLAQFEAKVFPLIEQVRLIKKQNRALVQARDALLPKLMSGQLDVPNICVQSMAEVV
jgi:type I restriction enzyme, S subunit